ncbi:helix-turn-helix domain-containing protein [Gorillibacterium sp. CAU 1737]|uniref:helix-turn-helix domain-containing protein n=1 Tax=Gorillibacterium sp. CAU 1737 TaxID=3140362 RepID=UPI00325FF92C
MESARSIQAVLDYIEDQIEEPVDSDGLAERAAFSKSQFFKWFTHYTGQTPMNYVMRRKLHVASRRLLGAEESIVELAYRYGFESHEGFSRAFKRTYGVTPQSYRKRGYTFQEMRKASIRDGFERGDRRVDVQVVNKPTLYLLGIERFIGMGEGQRSFTQVWDEYFQGWERLFGQVSNRVRPEEEEDVALSLNDADGTLRYFVGFEVEGLEQVPEGAVGIEIPPLLYAKATHKGPIAETLGETIRYVYGEWFESQTFLTAHLPDTPFAVMEVYDQRSTVTPPEMDIFIPIRRPTENRIIELPSREAVHYRAVGDDLGKLKYEAMDAILNWVERNGLANGPQVKLGVRYGETEEQESFCEVSFDLTDVPTGWAETEKVKRKTYSGGTYAVSPGVHHFLEKDWRAFIRWIEQKSDYRPCWEGFEEFHIQDGRVGFYTELRFYQLVERKPSSV